MGPVRMGRILIALCPYALILTGPAIEALLS